MSHRPIRSLNDLAKKVIQVCKVNKQGELLTNKAMSPRKVREFYSQKVPPVLWSWRVAVAFILIT